MNTCSVFSFQSLGVRAEYFRSASLKAVLKNEMNSIKSKMMDTRRKIQKKIDDLDDP